MNNVDSGSGDVAQVSECLSSMLKALISYTNHSDLMWWLILAVPVLGMWRQDNQKLKESLGYMIMRLGMEV